MEHGAMQDGRGRWVRWVWWDIDGRRHVSLSRPVRRRPRGWRRGVVLGVARVMGKGAVVALAVVGVLVWLGMV